MSSNYPVTSQERESQRFKGLHFGVFGNGPSKRVVSFRSSCSSDDACFSRWECKECNYENGDAASRNCSMCGTIRRLGSIEKDSNFLQNALSVATMNEDVNDNERENMIGRMNASFKQSSLRRFLFKHNESNNDSSLYPGLPNDIQIQGKEDDFATSYALLSLEECGHWACPDCTFVNTNELHLMCEVCGRTKPSNWNKSHDVLNQMSLRISDPSFLEPQINGLKKFEEMAKDKELATSLLDSKKHIFTSTLASDQFDLVELQSILEEGESTLNMLRKQYDDELKEFNDMVQHQRQVAKDIEKIEGMSPRDILERIGTRPGAQSISAQVLQWQGQERMLADWKLQLNDRHEELEEFHRHQQESLSRILK
jgi:rubrerythrin